MELERAGKICGPGAQSPGGNKIPQRELEAQVGLWQLTDTTEKHCRLAWKLGCSQEAAEDREGQSL